MYVYVPRPLVIVFAALAALLGAYIVREEGPALYRYLFKFEAM